MVAMGAALLLMLVFGVRYGAMRAAPSDLAENTRLAVDESAIFRDVYNQTLGVSMQPPQFHARC